MTMKISPLRITGFALLLFYLTSFQANAQKTTTSVLESQPYHQLPITAIKPKGWLLDQLHIMRDGTTGHLDEVYAKVKNDNGWLGGKGDGWEETPYWLDGAVPLAYLLDDKILKDKVLGYINWTIENQRPSGYFGPVTKEERERKVLITPDNCEAGEDWWPKMVMLKVMRQYYLASNDQRVIPFMTKYFKYQLQALKSCPIKKWSEWAESRGADNIMIVQWLYSINHDKSLIELANLIESQSFQWSDGLAIEPGQLEPQHSKMMTIGCAVML